MGEYNFSDLVKRVKSGTQSGTTAPATKFSGMVKQVKQQYSPEKTSSGIVTPDYGRGNIDLNDDFIPNFLGNKYTVYTDTATNEKVIIPAFQRGGFGAARQLSDEQAAEQYKASGKYYAKFALPSASKQRTQDINNSFGVGALKTDTVDEQIAAYIKELQSRDSDKRIASGTANLTDPEDFKRAAAAAAEKHAKERMGLAFADANSNAGTGLGLAVASGLQNFMTGVQNITPAYRHNQQMQGYNTGFQSIVTRERGQMDTANGVVFDLVSSLVQNAPSMAIGAITGSGIMNSALMFATTFGNDLQYAEAAGHDAKKAYTYAFMDGVVQAFMEQVGVIPGTKGITDTLVDGLTKNVHNAVGKFLINTASDMLGEGVEEMVQTALENGLKNAILGEKNDASLFSEEALYAAMLGALSGGLVGSVNIGVSNIASNTAVDTQTREAVREMLENQVLETGRKNGVDESTYSKVARLAGELGVSVRFQTADEIAVRDNAGNVISTPNGRYDRVGEYGTGTVVLNAEASTADAVEFLLKHELTHAIEGTAEWDTLVSSIRHAKGEERFTAEIQAKTEEYAAKGILLNENGAIQEIVADWVGQNLYRKGFIDAVLQHSDANKAQNLVARFRSFFNRNKNTAQASQLSQLERLFRKGIENRRFASAEDESAQYAIGYTDDNRPVVIISENILDGVPRTQWKDTVKDTIKDRFSGGVPVGGRLVKVNKITRGEYTWSGDSQSYSKNNPVIYEDKLKAGGTLDEIVLASTNYVNEDLNHERKDNFTQFARGDVLMRIGTNDYSAKVIIGWTSGNQMVLYDVVDFLPAKLNIKKADVSSPSSFGNPKQNSSNTSAFNTTVPQNGTGVNSYSMQNGGENSQFSFGEDDAQDLTTPVRSVTGNELAAEEAERFSADADDIALGHFSETTPPSRQSRDTSPDKGRQGDTANSQALGNLDNVVDLSFDNELAQRVAGVHGSAKYTIIQNYVLEVLGEQPITLSDGKQVIVDKSDARHVAKLSGDKKTAHISKIKELVESATLYAEDTQVEHNKFDYFCYYRANVRLNGEVFSIYLNVGRGINDGRYHLYDITQKIRDTANRIDGFERPKPNEGYALENGVSIDSIRNSAENVKGNSSLDDIPDAEDAMAEVEEKVSDSKKRKFTKAQEEHSRRRDALLEEYEAGAISKEEYKAALDELEQDAIRDNDKKWSTGKRGSAAEKQHAKNAVETYSSDTNTRLARREERVETAEQRAREKRMAKKCTEIRRSIHTTVDELAAKLARPSKNRFIPADLVEGIQNLLQLFEETPESIDNRVFELKKKMAETSDEGKKARLQKRLENLQNRNRLARENIQKIKIAYGRFCGEVSYGGEQHKFAVHKIKEELDALSDALFNTELDGMSYEDLRNVFNIVRGVAFQVNNAQKLFCKEHRGELQEQGEAQIDEALEAEAFYGKTLLKYDFVKKLVNWQLTPDRFFKMLGGFKKDSVWERTYNSFKEGQKRYFAILREFDEYFKSITDHAEFKRLASTNPNDLVDIGLKDTDGKPILLTRGMMLSMYMQLTCNMEQVIWSGLKIPELKTYYEYGITKDAYKNGTRISAKDFNQKLWELTEQMKTAQTPEDQSRIQEQITETVLLAQQDFNGMLEKIRGKLTEFESDFIEKAETWFNEISKNHINETTTQIFGYPKAMVERYFRIRRDTDFVETEMAGLAYNQTIESLGSLQARVKNTSPMLLTDLMDELTANCNDVARIVGFMAPETDFRRLYNVRKDMDHSVKEVLRRFGSELGHVGVSANQYVENLLADLTFGRKFEQGPLGWLYRNSVRAVMTLNPRVAMIQLAAWPTAAAELGWKTLGTSAKNLFKKPPIDLINKYSIYGYMRNRGDGGMQEFSAARQGHGVVDKLYNWVDDKTDGKVLGWCQKVDQGVVNSLWFACEEEIRRTRPKLKEGSEDFHKAVGELLDEVIIKTQSNGTTLEKPDLLRNKGAVMKILTSFKTDSMQQFNILFEGEMTHRRYVADFKAGKNGVTADDIAAAKRKKANAITSVVVGGVFCATILRMLANFLLQNTDKYRDEDGELTASSVTLAATSEMMGSMAGLVTFGDYIYEVVEAKLFGQRYYGISDMGLETLSDVLNTVATGDLSQGKTWGKLALNVSDALGIPANNVKKMFEAVAAHAEDIKNGEFLSMNGGYDVSASQYYSRLYKALQSDNEERAERIRRTLKGMEKTDAEIMAGLRAAIKKSDKQFKSIFDEMFADIRVTDLYKKLTEKEQKRVQSGIAGYVADTILADVTDGEMSDTNKKAARYAKKGVPEGDYFLAQVVKNAFFADTNKDEEVSRTEYAAALEDGGYSEVVRRMLLGLK